MASLLYSLGFLPPLVFLLGPASGFLIAHLIPDETQWYPKWMRIAAIMFMCGAAASNFNSDVSLFAISIVLFICTSFLMYKDYFWALAMSYGFLGGTMGLLGLQLLTISAIFTTTSFYSKGNRKSLLLWLLTPMLILSLKLLF